MSNEVKKSKVKLIADSLLATIAQIMGAMSIFMNSLFLIGAIAIIFDEADKSSIVAYIIALTFTLGLLIIGIFMLRWGRRTKKLIKTFRNYVCVISSGSNGKLEYISNIVDENQELVTSNIAKMIKKKYFVNAHIDKSKKELIIAGQSLSNTNLSEAVNTTCKSCGAISRNLISEDTRCEYCGSPL